VHQKKRFIPPISGWEGVTEMVNIAINRRMTENSELYIVVLAMDELHGSLSLILKTRTE
jgi:hypothetical protein